MDLDHNDIAFKTRVVVKHLKDGTVLVKRGTESTRLYKTVDGETLMAFADGGSKRSREQRLAFIGALLRLKDFDNVSTTFPDLDTLNAVAEASAAYEYRALEAGQSLVRESGDDIVHEHLFEIQAMLVSGPEASDADRLRAARALMTYNVNPGIHGTRYPVGFPAERLLALAKEVIEAEEARIAPAPTGAHKENPESGRSMVEAVSLIVVVLVIASLIMLMLSGCALPTTNPGETTFTTPWSTYVRKEKAAPAPAEADYECDPCTGVCKPK